jgi:hypothetical protein
MGHNIAVIYVSSNCTFRHLVGCDLWFVYLYDQCRRRFAVINITYLTSLSGATYFAPTHLYTFFTFDKNDTTNLTCLFASSFRILDEYCWESSCR